MRFLFFQDGLHVLSPEEQFKWLKSKEEACLAGISSNVSAATGEQSVVVSQATHTLNISHTRIVHVASQAKHPPPNLSHISVIHTAAYGISDHVYPSASEPEIRCIFASSEAQYPYFIWHFNQSMPPPHPTGHRLVLSNLSLIEQQRTEELINQTSPSNGRISLRRLFTTKWFFFSGSSSPFRALASYSVL
jgi:hypothetical protein